MSKQKSLTISICGPTNVGKSTFVNFIMKQKISIVSPKVQTTIKRIMAIYTNEETQLIFTDLPGFFKDKPKNALEKSILQEASATDESDYNILMIDAKKPEFKLIKEILKKINGKIIFVINKIDKIDKNSLLEVANELSQLTDFMSMFMISLKKNDGCEKLKNYLLNLQGNNYWVFSPDEITNLSHQEYASEITREAVLNYLQQELPYKINIETTDWNKRENKNDIVISQTIWVPNQNARKITLGYRGGLIKKIGIYSRQQLMNFFKQKIHIKLEVKIDKNSNVLNNNIKNN